jgi:hypothetical protein
LPLKALRVPCLIIRTPNRTAVNHRARHQCRHPAARLHRPTLLFEGGERTGGHGKGGAGHPTFGGK